MMYVASCSFGKDSLAMVLLLLSLGYPLDEVIFFDTGMEFDAIYAIRDKLLPILKENNIKYTELTPELPFLYEMLEKPVKGIKNPDHFGYGWCGGACRWGTSNKNRAITKYLSNLNEEYVEYVGIVERCTIFGGSFRHYILYFIQPIILYIGLNNTIGFFKTHYIIIWQFTPTVFS